MEAAEIESLAKRFFDAIEQGDVATVTACYDEKVVIWHNFDMLEQGRDDNLKVLAGMIERCPTRVYGARKVAVFPGGFVQQHVLTATRKDGKVVSLPAACICQVADGKIVRLDEYLDTAQAAAFRS